MNKKVIILLFIIALGVVGIVLANTFSGPDAGGSEIRTTEQVIENPRSAPEPRANSFGILSPEEKAARDAAAAEAERLAAASSTASTTDEAEETVGGE